MKRIVIFPNIKQPAVMEQAVVLADKLRAQGHEVRIDPAVTGKSDLLMVMGGDGTFLHYAARLQACDVPVMAVNCGHLGFMSTVEIEDFDQVWPLVERGSYTIERRMMTDVTVLRGGVSVFEAVSLNEAVIAKGALSRMGRLEIGVDGHWMDTLPADGIIVATPTGSTAYSLSAGGPLVNPRLSLMIITPIAAHALYARPVIVPGDAEVTVTSAGSDSHFLTVDGREDFCLAPGDTVRVRRSKASVDLIKLEGVSYYETLRRKLRHTEVKPSAH